ncbi:5-formyltetrahydrofolate cyclo-ligase [Rhodoblastus acidophilus]|uniref:5-formyltetrahydrofolate cyclo-ligase n=1 Tax=Rhodoblastus acidophilus TaxID=1074 RepID=UPI002224FCEF|nr:5-formyltetrahydrofolate cyclo-ligase [Rhodoblastus acidophilus]
MIGNDPEHSPLSPTPVGRGNAKAELRALFKQVRASIPPDHAQTAALAIAETASPFLSRLVQKVGLPPAETPIALYRALPGELDCAPLLALLVKMGFPTLLPCAAEKATPLAFRLWRPGDPLVGGRFGLSEPAPEGAEITPKILLAPLLAFDDAGGRLGFGGGYYDATLARLRADDRFLAAGGLAFSRQQAEKLPMEKHDAPLDFVVTEKDILNFMGDRCGFSSSAT